MLLRLLVCLLLEPTAEIEAAAATRSNPLCCWYIWWACSAVACCGLLCLLHACKKSGNTYPSHLNSCCTHKITTTNHHRHRWICRSKEKLSPRINETRSLRKPHHRRHHPRRSSRRPRYRQRRPLILLIILLEQHVTRKSP